MWPEVFRITLFDREFPLKSFGLFVACGFLVGFWLGKRLSFRYGSNPQEDYKAASDVCWWVLIGAIFGARLGYVIVNLDDFIRDPIAIFKIWEGGLVMYGGLILAIALGYWKIRQNRIQFWQTADYGLTAGFLGQAIGRLGCLAVGDDFGRVTDVPWALRVPDPLPAHSLFDPALAGQLVHPTQLYLSANALGLFLLGLVLLPRRRFKGQVFAILLLVYAIMRFVIEIYRGDSVARGGIWRVSPEEAAELGVVPELLLSTSQLVGLGAIPLILLLYLWLKHRPDATTANPGFPVAQEDFRAKAEAAEAS